MNKLKIHRFIWKFLWFSSEALTNRGDFIGNTTTQVDQRTASDPASREELGLYLYFTSSAKYI